MLVRCPDCDARYEITTPVSMDEKVNVRCPRCKSGCLGRCPPFAEGREMPRPEHVVAAITVQVCYCNILDGARRWEDFGAHKAAIAARGIPRIVVEGRSGLR